MSTTVAAMAYLWGKGRAASSPRDQPQAAALGSLGNRNAAAEKRQDAGSRRGDGQGSSGTSGTVRGDDVRRVRTERTEPAPRSATRDGPDATCVDSKIHAIAANPFPHRTPRSRPRRRRRRPARRKARPPERRRRAARGPRARAGAGTRRRRPRAPPAHYMRAWRTCGGRGLGQRGGIVGVVLNGPSRGIEPSRGSAARSRDPSAVQRRDSRRTVDAIDATRRRARTPPQNRGSANNAPAP